MPRVRQVTSLHYSVGFMVACVGVVSLALWWNNRVNSAISNFGAPISLASKTPKPKNRVPSPVVLTDVTRSAGITFKHNAGAFGLKLYPETMGGGVAFIDYDGDGYQDIFFVNGRDWTPQEVAAYRNGKGREHLSRYGFAGPTAPPYKRTTGALYHNNGNGTFTDVTAQSGLAIEMQGMGVAVGDYDGDGRPDLYVTSYGRNYLFRNQCTRGKVLFREEAKAVGVEDGGFGTSAAFVDYDRDGKLDLFVCRYIEWIPAIDVWNFGSQKRGPHGFLKAYSGPNGYDGQMNHLYRNIGNGHFVNVTDKVGVRTGVAKDALSPREVKLLDAAMSKRGPGVPQTNGEISTNYRRPLKRQGKGMGVTLSDINNDGWLDLIVTNDQVPTTLLRNNGNGTFTDIGVRSGIAYSSAGLARAGMGVDAGDIDHSGRDSMVVGNFDHEYIGLYYNEAGYFTDIAAPAEVAGASQESVTFGCAFLDINNDGWLDIMAANGHAQDTIHNLRRDLQYEERPLLYLNRRQKKPIKFDEVGLSCGPAMQTPLAGRGLAYADIDLDGDVDVVITTIAGPPLVLRNDPAPGTTPNNSLRLVLEGEGGNRSAIGARIEATVARSDGNGTETLRRMVKSGSSYLSQSELPLTLGLGPQNQVQALVIHWPSGGQTQFKNLAANQIVTIRQDQGIIRRQAFKKMR